MLFLSRGKNHDFNSFHFHSDQNGKLGHKWYIKISIKWGIEMLYGSIQRENINGKGGKNAVGVEPKDNHGKSFGIGFNFE